MEIFNEKKELVLKNELFDKCEFWLVTNTEKLMEGIKEYANTHDIKIKVAQLPNNWKGRSDWSINTLTEI